MFKWSILEMLVQQMGLQFQQELLKLEQWILDQYSCCPPVRLKVTLPHQLSHLLETSKLG
jgi:hypothetical protein